MLLSRSPALSAQDVVFVSVGLNASIITTCVALLVKVASDPLAEAVLWGSHAVHAVRTVQQALLKNLRGGRCVKRRVLLQAAADGGSGLVQTAVAAALSLAEEPARAKCSAPSASAFWWWRRECLPLEER